MTLSGTCKRPGAAALVDCEAGTMVTASRCDDPAACLEDAAARTRLGADAVTAAGAFAIVVGAEAARGILHFEAEIDAAVIYRLVDFGRAAPGAGTGDRAAVVIDPSSEG